MFFDFNLDRRVYVRTGKQVLQWGRCTLWNPTDLVNVEKPTFIRKIGYREGAYGLKLHAPFGAEQNIYGFLDTGNAPTTDKLGGALKYEFLVGRTEMAFSGWAKKTYNPVAGYDFSTRVGDVDIVGEASVSKGDNVKKVFLDDGFLDVRRNEKEWAPLAAVNVSKGFPLGNFNDRLKVAGEFFYNQPGYQKHFFDDASVYPLRNSLAIPSAPPPASTKAGLLLADNLYTMNYFSKYYGALFTSVGRFIVTDMTLNMNYIRNIDDGTGIVSAGVTYTNLADLTLGALVNLLTGPRNGEYTTLKAVYDVQLTAGISF
jgi:hypothetical protein